MTDPKTVKLDAETESEIDDAYAVAETWADPDKTRDLLRAQRIAGIDQGRREIQERREAFESGAVAALKAKLAEKEAEVERVTTSANAWAETCRGLEDRLEQAQAALGRLRVGAEKLLHAYGEAHALYDLGECEGSMLVRAELSPAPSPDAKKEAGQ